MQYNKCNYKLQQLQIKTINCKYRGIYVYYNVIYFTNVYIFITEVYNVY